MGMSTKFNILMQASSDEDYEEEEEEEVEEEEKKVEAPPVVEEKRPARGGAWKPFAGATRRRPNDPQNFWNLMTRGAKDTMKEEEMDSLVPGLYRHIQSAKVTDKVDFTNHNMVMKRLMRVPIKLAKLFVSTFGYGLDAMTRYQDANSKFFQTPVTWTLYFPIPFPVSFHELPDTTEKIGLGFYDYNSFEAVKIESLAIRAMTVLHHKRLVIMKFPGMASTDKIQLVNSFLAEQGGGFYWREANQGSNSLSITVVVGSAKADAVKAVHDEGDRLFSKMKRGNDRGKPSYVDKKKVSTLYSKG